MEGESDIKVSPNKTAPAFIRQFSKQNSPDERQQKASEIRQKRTEYFERKKGLSVRKGKIDLEKEEKRAELSVVKNEIQATEEMIDALSDKWPARALKYFEMKKLNKNKEAQTGDLTSQVSDLLKLEKEERAVAKGLEERGINAELGEARDLLKSFYDKEKAKWKDTPFTKKDVQEFFTEEHLSSLSLQDYATLLKRFPSEMVTHVTRQGVRDHSGHTGHVAGMWEYHTEFEEILADGRLQSATGVYFKEGMTKEAVVDLLSLDKFWNKEAALRFINLASREIAPGGYSDKKAMHFAVEDVADMYYGAEDGNEIFFAFPSAFIAANYYFGGSVNLNRDDGLSDGWNDAWVWDENDKGISINAGVTFMPTGVDVDPNTGSTYLLDENKKPVEDQGNIDFLKKIIRDDEIYALTKTFYSSSDIDKLGEAVRAAINNKYGLPPDFTPFFSSSDGLFAIKFNGDAERGIGDPPFLAVFKERGLDYYIPFILKSKKLLYKRPEQTVDAKDYWEKYFANHPNQRPNKIVYYSGDPSTILKRWKAGNGLVKRSSDSSFGFDEHVGKPNSPEKESKFYQLATEAIDDCFGV